MPLHYLIPTYDTLEAGIPDKDLLYPENTFIDILSGKAEIYIQKFNAGKNDRDYLEMASQSLDLARSANDKLRFLQVNDASKLVNIRANKKLINKAIELEFLKYQKKPESRVLDRVRDLLNHSKGLLLKNKSGLLANLNKLPKAKKKQIMNNRDSLSNLYNKKRNTQNPDSIDQIYNRILDLEQDIQTLLRDVDEQPVVIPIVENPISNISLRIRMFSP